MSGFWRLGDVCLASDLARRDRQVIIKEALERNKSKSWGELVHVQKIWSAMYVSHEHYANCIILRWNAESSITCCDKEILFFHNRDWHHGVNLDSDFACGCTPAKNKSLRDFHRVSVWVPKGAGLYLFCQMHFDNFQILIRMFATRAQHAAGQLRVYFSQKAPDFREQIITFTINCLLWIRKRFYTELT